MSTLLDFAEGRTVLRCALMPSVFVAITSPRILAAMIAQEMRRVGFVVEYHASESSFNDDRQGHAWRVRGDQTIAIGVPGAPVNVIEMEKAREVLSVLMSCANGEHVNADKRLRSIL